MSEASARFGLPFLQSGQAQKELFHNEALSLVDLAMHPAAEAFEVNTPPTDAQPGQCWIVGPNPTGAWAGQEGSLAGWTTGGWRFVPPATGMLVWVAGAGSWAQRSSGGWTLGEVSASTIRINGQQVLTARQPHIAHPAGGGIVDTEARTAISALLTALEAHGLIAA